MSADRVVRIANGQGFWGDSIDAPVRQIEEGPLDYLTLDYLSEVTMSIMQKLKKRDPAEGLRDRLHRPDPPHACRRTPARRTIKRRSPTPAA